MIIMVIANLAVGVIIIFCICSLKLKTVAILIMYGIF